MLIPAASATADPTMAPIALLARAAVICKKYYWNLGELLS